MRISSFIKFGLAVTVLTWTGSGKAEESNEAEPDCYGDETLRKCNSSARCIPLRWFCDGKSDCVEDGDNPIDEDPELCRDNCMGLDERFQCADKACLRPLAACDGIQNCKDRSDETLELCADCNGDETRFNCAGSSICLHKSLLCDGYKDCRSGSDEENCA